MAEREGPQGWYPADGEKLSSTQLADTHVLHPGVGTYFQRSSLVIGSKGAGKTFLLRHRKYTSHPGAIYMNLFKALHSIARDSGLGGRAVNIGPRVALAIEAKTAALIGTLALELACKDAGGSLDFPLSSLSPLLPAKLHRRSSADEESAKDLRRSIQRVPLSEWTTADALYQLVDALTELSNACSDSFALFLDRAEDVSTPSMELLLNLLDQSIEFLVVIAGRPAISQLIPVSHNPTSVPDDHYHILHLGMQPYGQPWREFTQAATDNYLKANDGQGLAWADGHEWVTRMSRDSVRLSVNLAQISADTDGPGYLGDRIVQVRALRASRLASASAGLLPDYRDFRQVLQEMHSRCGDKIRSGDPFILHAGFEDLDEVQLSLLGDRTDITNYLLRAIRVDALCLPQNYKWHPYELPNEFEVNPLLAWDGENSTWIS